MPVPVQPIPTTDVTIDLITQGNKWRMYFSDIGYVKSMFFSKGIYLKKIGLNNGC